MEKSTSRADEILFGGSATAPFAPGETGDQPQAWRAIEAAFLQLTTTPEGRERYGDPNRGATLLQAWNTVQLFGVPPRICLLTTGQPRVTANGITRVVSLASDDFVAALARLLTWERPMAAQLFTFDGRTGHSVTLHDADDDGSGFTFHDPWPGDSLLSKQQNAAGGDAQRAGTRWHMTAAELATVGIAAFVPPLPWAEMTGQPGRIKYEELQATEFWSRFHIHESARQPREPAGLEVALTTGGFAEHLTLQLVLGDRGFVTLAELRLREAWLFGPPWGVNPFATDVAASFVTALTPPLDRPQIEPISDTIRGFRLDEANKARLTDQQFVASLPGQALQAYAGVGQDSFHLVMAGSVLSIDSQADEGERWRSFHISCV